MRTEPKHNLLPFFLAVLLSALNADIDSFAQVNSNPDTVSQALTVIVTADNDLSLDENPSGERVNVPHKVQAVIFDIARNAFMQYLGNCGSREDCGTITLGEFYGPIFRVKAPQSRYLFIFTLEGPFGWGYYNFIMYDYKSELVTKEPGQVYNRWMDAGDSLLEKPIVSFDDLDQDGQNELVVEERVHNGTMYNAVVYHYFSIEPDLSLKPIFEMESRLLDLYTEAQRGVIVRTLKKITPGTLKMEVFLQVPNQKDQKLGEVIFSRENRNDRFKIHSRKAMNPKYEPLLITGAEEENN